MKDALGAVQSVLVLGGASEIGVAIAARLAPARHATVVLAGRHHDALTAAAATVRAAGAGQVATLSFDADDTDSHEEVLRRRGQTRRRRHRRRGAGLRSPRRPGDR